MHQTSSFLEPTNQTSSPNKTSNTNQLIIHGIYRHYKGDYYIVEDIATHSETGEELVIYRGLYENAPLWARPKTLFLSKIDPKNYPQGHNQKYRFELQNIKSIAEH